jgi:hypothetical protein
MGRNQLYVGNVGVALVATHFGFNIVFMPKNGWPQGIAVKLIILYFLCY